jgi:hypothetical protein
MRHLIYGEKWRPARLIFAERWRLARLLGACGLLAAGIGASALLPVDIAQAVACGPPIAAGTPCTLTGTLGVTAGPLTLTSPTALGWATTATGLDQQLVDPTLAHQSYVVNDASGVAAGWHVTVSATTFTSGALTLPNAGTFVTTGSITAEAATTAPTAACASGSTCTLPADTTTYPVAITTAAAAPVSVNIYSTGVNTGIGSITIGIGANPVGWWVNVPARTLAGTYTSTVTRQIIAGP